MAIIRLDRAQAAPGYVLSYLTHPAIKSYIEAFQIPLPPLPEQQGIAYLLGALDDKIELNSGMNETLEAMARALFKDWFVDFGPTRARQEGLEPYLTPELWSLFPDRLDVEGKPEGWEPQPLLHNHARLVSGGTPKTEVTEYWGGPISWASAKDVSQCGQPFLVATEQTITQRGLEESATRLIPRYVTVVVARDATTGRFCLFGDAMAMNQTCDALTSPQGQSFWLNCAFDALIDHLTQSGHGSVFNTITTKTIESARVMIATNGLIEHFERMVEPLFTRMLANIEESRTLAQTRNLLLPKLMSGEVRIRDAESVVESVL
ncbi:restriction endonuclease subunit S [uncultured Thiodictyon sp.]|uniref:restriction endonuclease subunit S n=1 Tax=uncultured Thiodictyon sp. TaxID=1846217 RepID=UPI0025CB983A|nr:restriction endonuclease subunit S [uncultured Thiodictyon sp.]